MLCSVLLVVGWRDWGRGLVGVVIRNPAILLHSRAEQLSRMSEASFAPSKAGARGKGSSGGAATTRKGRDQRVGYQQFHRSSLDSGLVPGVSIPPPAPERATDRLLAPHRRLAE